MKKGFSSEVEAWIAKSKARAKFVMKESTTILLREANRPVPEGGNLPFKDGFLRNSLVAGNGEPSGDGITGSSDITLAISKMEPGVTFCAGWTAEYAMRMEYGFNDVDTLGRAYNQRGFGFREKAAQKWPDYVESTVNSAKRIIK